MKKTKYLALGTRQGISTSNSTGRPRKPLKRSKVTWVICWTLVGQPMSMWWRVLLVGMTSSPPSSMRQATRDFLIAVNTNAIIDSCWFCTCSWWSCNSLLFVPFVPLPPTPPPHPPPFVTITRPVISAIEKYEKERKRREEKKEFVISEVWSSKLALSLFLTKLEFKRPLVSNFRRTLSLSLVYLYNLTLSVSCLLTFLTSLFVDITVNAIQQISSNFIKFSNQLFNCSWPYFYCLLAEILIRPYTLYDEEFRNRW